MKVAKSAFLVTEQVDILVSIVVVAEVARNVMMAGFIVMNVVETGRSLALIVMVQATILMLVATIVVDGELCLMGENAQHVAEADVI